MADAVTSQTILDGDRLFIGKYTNYSDGTGESGVIKIDVTTLAPNQFGLACTSLTLQKVWGTTHGMEVQILWDATTDQFCWLVPQNTNYLMDLSSFGGIKNNAGTGKTGNITFTTRDVTAGDMYAIVLECTKNYG